MSAKRIRRRFTAQFKAEVALAALQERQTLAALAVKYQLAPEQIATWKQQLQQQTAQVFAPEPGVGAAAGGLDAAEVEALYAQLGRLQMENTLLKKRCPDECAHLTRKGAGRRRKPAASPSVERPWGWRAAATTTSRAARQRRIWP